MSADTSLARSSSLRNSGHRPARKRGFALIITITLLAFLVLLLVSLASMTRVETQVATNTRELSQARQNAVYALQIALGQLQKYAGADQRITAPATTIFPSDSPADPVKFKDVTKGRGELYDGGATFGVGSGYRNLATTSNNRSYLNRVGTYLTPNERTQWDAAIKSFWNNGRSPHYVGVLDASLREDRASNPATASILPAERYENDPATKFGEPQRSQLPVWLVSGVENYIIDQQNGTVRDTSGNDRLAEYFSDYSPTSVIPLPASNNNTTILVGYTSATKSQDSTEGTEGRVIVRKQPIKGSDGSTLGSYAYWVGDESLKANFAVRDPYAGASVNSSEYRNRLQVPQRLGWERMTGFTSLSFNPNNPVDPFYALFPKIVTYSQIPFLDPILKDDPNGNRGALQRNFHNITGSSQSLLTDAVLGGLKKDLTRYLISGTGLQGASPVADPNLYRTTDARFNAWRSANGTTNIGFPNTTTNIPTWRQVRDWYQNQSNGSTAINPSGSTAPILSYIMLQAGLSYEPTSQLVYWHWIPCIVLWNPYDVKLESATYDLDVSVAPTLSSFYIVKETPDLNELQAVTGGANWTGTPGMRSTYKYTAQDNSIQNISLAAPDTIPFSGSTGPNFTKDSDNNTVTDNGTTDRFGRYFYRLTKDGIYDIGMFFSNSNAPGGTPIAGRNVAHSISPNNDGNPSSTVPVYPVKRPLRFSISSPFNAGEVKVFTVSSEVIWDTQLRVPLSNDYDPSRPPSLRFAIGRIIGGPSSASGLKFMFDQTQSAIPAPAVKLTVNGETIMEAQNSLGEIRWNNIMSNIRGASYEAYVGFGGSPQATADADADGTINRSEPSPKFVHTWRSLYDSADFNSKILSQAVNDNTSSIFPYGVTWVQPLTSDGGLSQANILNYVPVFSRFNLAARTWDAHPLVDAKRSLDGENNRNENGQAEGFSKLFYIRSADGAKWDNNQASGDKGFALISPSNSDPTSTYTGLSTLSIRNAMRSNSELLSLGQLQQVNVSSLFWQPAFPIGNSFASPYTDREAIAGINSRRVGGAVGNVSFVGSIIHSGGPLGYIANDSANRMIDLSYLLNENLWDRYFLSSINGTPSLTSPLPNSRHRFTADANSPDANLSSFHTASAYLYNVGALNINSTSVEAWKALLTSFRNLKLTGGGQQNPADTTPIARSLDPISNPIRFTDATQNTTDIGAVATNKDYSKIVGGFRYLTDPMIDTLARRIVDEIRLRGPFYSLADFVNRRLVAPAGSHTTGSPWYDSRTNGYVGDEGLNPPTTDDNHVDFMSPQYDPFIGLQGLSGAIQRAIQVSGINGGVNDYRFGDSGTAAGTNEDRVYSVRIRNGPTTNGDQYINNANQNWLAKSSPTGQNSNNTVKHTQEPSFRGHIDSEHIAAAPVGEAGQLFDGTPGFVTQGDILAMIGPALTPRGDTFMIRTYGESVNPSTGEVIGKAWLEAIAQRTYEPVNRASNSPADEQDYWRYTDEFGRKFQIISFRWLSADEL